MYGNSFHHGGGGGVRPSSTTATAAFSLTPLLLFLLLPLVGGEGGGTKGCTVIVPTRSPVVARSRNATRTRKKIKTHYTQNPDTRHYYYSMARANTRM